MITDGLDEIGRDAQERAWLVRLCTRLTGTPDAADDLAQETLLEAWRHAHKLHDPAGRERWLAVIARNVCFRWRRSHWRTASRQAALDPEEVVADIPAIGYRLERRELVELLDQALALLPEETRRLLLERYVQELPYRSIAERLGVSEDAVSMRLSRGRLLLRQVLITELREATISYKIEVAAGDGWQTTRLWCQICGQERLRARLPHTTGTVAFQCPGCNSDPAVASVAFPLTNTHFSQLLGGLQRPKVILRRATAWAHNYFRDALVERAACCTNCGRPVALQVAFPDERIPVQEQPANFLYAVCTACHTRVSTSFRGLVGSFPEVQLFWDTQRRIRMLPPYEVEVGGQAALVTRYESLTGSALLEVIAIKNPRLLFDTYQVVQSTRQ